ncbi:MAG TPA: GAF domain-containing protein [Conexibacter sp.]|nr:GAF domain-containing protein [Conexibacter sp.]
MRPASAAPGSEEPPGLEPLAARKLRALSEIGSIVVSGADYEQVLADVIEKIAGLLHAHGGGVMLYDAEAGALVTQQPAFGLSPELVNEYRVSLSDGGNAASVFVTGEPYVTNDARHDPRVIRRFAVRHAITRLLTVPLRIEGQSIGVFHAIDKVDGDFDADDLELMTAIAPQLAVIVHSAMIMRQLREHERQLERVLELHDEFTDMLLRGEGAHPLLARLSQLVDLPVLLLDATGAVTATSAEADELAGHEPLLREAADDWGEHDRVRTLRLDDARSLVAVRVNVGADTLGFLVAAHAHDADTAEDVRVLEQASVLFALDIVRARELDAVRGRLEDDIVEHLLAASAPEEAASLLRRLHVPVAERYRCAVLELRPGERLAALSSQFQTLIARLQRELRARLAQEAPHAVVVEHAHALWIVLPETPDDPAFRDDALPRAIGGLRAGIAEADFVVGVGTSVAEPLELKRSSEEAGIAAAVARRVGTRRPVLLYEELGVYGLLAQPAGGEEMRRFVETVLGPLAAYDTEHDSGWTEFLETLVQTNFRVTNAAALAGCHINTAKYRVARIEELLGRDFQSAADRFAIQLALEIRTLGAILDA